MHVQLINKGVFMLGLMANRGLFQSKYKSPDLRQMWLKDIFLTKDLPYHWYYLLVCLLGLIGHDFLYCFLVSGCGLWVWFGRGGAWSNDGVWWIREAGLQLAGEPPKCQHLQDVEGVS